MAKVNHVVVGSQVVFRGGELTLDLAKYERDFEVKIDVTENEFGQLQLGLSKKYVAQIIIPAREYKESPYQKENDNGEMETLIEKIAQPYDISKTTINSVEVQ